MISDCRSWPFWKMRTKAVSGGKLPSPPRPVKRGIVAVHTSFSAVPGRVTTRVLSTGTRTGLGHVRASTGLGDHGQSTTETRRSRERSANADAIPSAADVPGANLKRRSGPAQLNRCYESRCAEVVSRIGWSTRPTCSKFAAVPEAANQGGCTPPQPSLSRL
jgi:hypothetical protein